MAREKKVAMFCPVCEKKVYVDCEGDDCPECG